MTFILTPGQMHEAPLFESLLQSGAVKRQGRGRPKQRPHRLVGDKSYDSRAIRTWLRRHGIRITIPRRANECRTGPFSREYYRARNRIERLINRLKQYRRIATRYEKCAVNYRAMWLIAATLHWL
jgi:transposase